MSAILTQPQCVKLLTVLIWGYHGKSVQTSWQNKIVIYWFPIVFYCHLQTRILLGQVLWYIFEHISHKLLIIIGAHPIATGATLMNIEKYIKSIH